MNQYEAVFILNPVLSEEQIKEAVKKFESFLNDKGAKFVNKENWGLKKLAYPIQNKKSGFYNLFEFTGDIVIPIFPNGRGAKPLFSEMFSQDFPPSVDLYKLHSGPPPNIL